jgi:hypothetical protein
VLDHASLLTTGPLLENGHTVAHEVQVMDPKPGDLSPAWTHHCHVDHEAVLAEALGQAVDFIVVQDLGDAWRSLADPDFATRIVESSLVIYGE